MLEECGTFIELFREPLTMRSFCFICILVAILLLGTGCNTQPTQPLVVRGVDINGYEFDYELAPPMSILVDRQALSISTGNIKLVIADDNLQVDGRSYGGVKPKDRISVIGGKVSVNGEERKPGA